MCSVEYVSDGSIKQLKQQANPSLSPCVRVSELRWERGEGAQTQWSCRGQDAEWTEGVEPGEKKHVVPLEWQAPWMSWRMQCDGHVARGMRAARGQ